MGDSLSGVIYTLYSQSVNNKLKKRNKNSVLTKGYYSTSIIFGIGFRINSIGVKSMKIILNIIIIYFIAAYFMGWPPFIKEWTGFVYEDSSMVNSVTTGPYDSFEKCMAESEILLTEKDWESGFVECGLNCQHDPGTDLNICSETRR